MTTTKQPDTIAWEKWRDSEEGLYARYAEVNEWYNLLNRLEAAFQAGVKAGREGNEKE